MSRLAALQHDFQAYLLADQQPGRLQSRIIDDASVGAARRLAIYHDAYRLRLIEALTSAYPKLQLLLGDDLFDSTARAYIDANPSVYRNLRWYGATLSEHLAQALPQHPVTAELAAFEWALALAFDAADMPVLQVEDLAAVPPEQWGELRFRLHASMRLLPLQCNTVAVWQALDAEQAPPPVATLTETWLIWRREFNPHFRSLDVAELAALELIIAGASFGDICASLQIELGEDAATMQAAQYLATWLGDGLISQLQAD